MLAQGAKYQKRESFTNDAASGKKFIPRHMWFIWYTNDNMKCAVWTGKVKESVCHQSVKGDCTHSPNIED